MRFEQQLDYHIIMLSVDCIAEGLVVDVEVDPRLARDHRLNAEYQAPSKPPNFRHD